MAKNWLSGRAEILGRYAKGLPKKIDEVWVVFDYPDTGWMNGHWFKNGKEMGLTVFSSAYEGFVQFKKWLEDIANLERENAPSVCIDCEHGKLVFYYEPIWFFDDRETEGTKLWHHNCGIFSIYDELEDKFLFDAYCDTELFLRTIYGCLIHQAKKMQENPDFVDDWIWESFNTEAGKLFDEGDEEGLRNLFVTKLTSPIVEKYLEYCDSWHKNQARFGNDPKCIPYCTPREYII